MRTPKLVEIEWEDHAFWLGPHEDGEWVCKQISIGYLVQETKKYIKLAQSLTDGRPGDCLVVDKKMLKKKRVIRS